jgi:hypothetical protein
MLYEHGMLIAPSRFFIPVNAVFARDIGLSVDASGKPFLNAFPIAVACLPASAVITVIHWF